MNRVEIDVSKLDTTMRVNRALKAGAILAIITSSKEAHDMILSMPIKWRRGESSKWKKKSNLELLMHLISGAEEWNGKKDKTINIEIDDYRRMLSKVIGYMIPGKKTVFVNTKYFDTMDMKKVVSNLFHEWGHTMGLRHSGKYFRSSIPYFLNTVVEELYPLALAGQLTPATEDMDEPTTPETPVPTLPKPEQVQWVKKCYKPKWYYLVPWLWNNQVCKYVKA